MVDARLAPLGSLDLDPEGGGGRVGRALHQEGHDVQAVHALVPTHGHAAQRLGLLVELQEPVLGQHRRGVPAQPVRAAFRAV